MTTTHSFFLGRFAARVFVESVHIGAVLEEGHGVHGGSRSRTGRRGAYDSIVAAVGGQAGSLINRNGQDGTVAVLHEQAVVDEGLKGTFHPVLGVVAQMLPPIEAVGRASQGAGRVTDPCVLCDDATVAARWDGTGLAMVRLDVIWQELTFGVLGRPARDAVEFGIDVDESSIDALGVA